MSLRGTRQLRGYKTHKRLIINEIVKRFGIKKASNTEGVCDFIIFKESIKC